jgi:hypothetical protein
LRTAPAWSSRKNSRRLSFANCQQHTLNVRSSDVLERHLPDQWKDMILDICTVGNNAPGLFVQFGVVADVKPTKVRDTGSLAFSLSAGADVGSHRDFGDPLTGDLTRLFGRQRAMYPDGRATLLARSGAVIQKVRPTPGWRDLQTEAFDFRIPNDNVLAANRHGLHGLLGKPCSHPHRHLSGST